MSGPYSIRHINAYSAYVVGPTDPVVSFQRGDADRLCDWLNAAFAAGYQAALPIPHVKAQIAEDAEIAARRSTEGCTAEPIQTVTAESDPLVTAENQTPQS